MHLCVISSAAYSLYQMSMRPCFPLLPRAHVRGGGGGACTTDCAYLRQAPISMPAQSPHTLLYLVCVRPAQVRGCWAATSQGGYLKIKVSPSGVLQEAAGGAVEGGWGRLEEVEGVDVLVLHWQV